MSDSSEPNASPSSPSNRFFASKTDLCLWITRLLTIGFTVLYLCAIWPNSSYQKALLASAATSALRLHQRLPPFRLTRDYLSLVILEDSAHYLLYALLFVTCSSAVSLALLPISLFAVLHWSSMTLLVVNRESRLGGVLTSLVQQYQRSILQTVALTEIMLMPCLVLCVFSGVVSLLTPVVYFRFVSLRYSSRRNPYTRQMMFELRMAAERALRHNYCPLFVQRIGFSLIQLISRLS